MKLKSAAILLNKKKQWAKELGLAVRSFLIQNGVEVKNPPDSQIIITIGGDGTILYHKSEFIHPIFAIGSGTSFICNAHKDTWESVLIGIIKNGFVLERRTMLSSWLDGKKLPDALNEVVIRNREHRILSLRLFVGNKRYVFEADGILFSTATGSYAYAYSCGGEEMPHLAKNYQVVAIAPYRRRFSPLMVNPGMTCEVHVDSTCDADAVIDGQYEVPVKRKCILIVKRSKREFLFVRAKE